MMSEELDKQISDYLDDKMTDSDLRVFEEKLSKDAHLAEEVNDFKALDEGLQAVGMEKFRLAVKEWEQDINIAHPPLVTWKKYLAVAAVIALILVPAIYLLTGQQANSEELFLSYYEPYDELIISRGNSVDSLEMLLADGMEAYNLGAYRKCSDLLISYLQQQPEAHRVALYLAIAQLELNQKEMAEANFIRAQEDPVFKQQAQWYQALSYLKFSETEKAMVMLRSIVNSKNHYRKNEASRLLRELG
jgi:hypothetical protein